MHFSLNVVHELCTTYNEALLVQGAESGDFGEWTSDLGVKLDLAVSSMYGDNEASSYELVGLCNWL